jgi:hypothetical protein
MKEMIDKFRSIVLALIQAQGKQGDFFVCSASNHFDDQSDDATRVSRSLNAAFLITLSADSHPDFVRAEAYLNRMADSSEWGESARFYVRAKSLIRSEIESVSRRDSGFSERLDSLFKWISRKSYVEDPHETRERVWRLFFPEASGILANRKEQINALRAKRTVNITKLNPSPILDPGREILFTSNVLLTIPSSGRSLDTLPYSPHLKKSLRGIIREPQICYYDHPIQMGVEREKNEVFYGLQGLDKAFEFERERGNMSRDVRPVCVLSVATTHHGLRSVAKTWLKEEFAGSDGPKNMDVVAFTEADTRQIIHDILAPAAKHYLRHEDTEALLSVLGVDGPYGRHYSFLKAIAPFWAILIQPAIKATFKIDLDQVFPQEKLIEETEASAFEHFMTPLWGGQGLDSDGRPLDLGMIAGALVNEQDSEDSLFTPDVPFPDRTVSSDEHVFYSTLTQALSTEAEMMARYDKHHLDGKSACLQRIHVTGGTTGILVESLRRYLPFTPSFIGRAEDQAYILSVLLRPGKRLAYAHKDGLIMRHDKASFAQEAMKSASLGKIIGDYLRILFFSAYANALVDDVAELKETLDPFTGCFISRIPITVTFLRFALKTASFFSEGEEMQGAEFIRQGSRRIADAVDFVDGKHSTLTRVLKKERLGWDLYYDTLSAIEEGLTREEEFALALREKAQGIIEGCFIRF